MFDIRIGNESRQRGLLRLALGAFLERDVAVGAGGARDRHVDAG